MSGRRECDDVAPLAPDDARLPATVEQAWHTLEARRRRIAHLEAELVAARRDRPAPRVCRVCGRPGDATLCSERCLTLAHRMGAPPA